MLFDKSALSPYIRFGCLSVRYFLFEVKKLANKDTAVEPLLKDVTGKLLQREFYCTVAKQVNKALHYSVCVITGWLEKKNLDREFFCVCVHSFARKLAFWDFSLCILM